MDVCFQRATCNMFAIFISRHSISNLIAPAEEEGGEDGGVATAVRHCAASSLLFLSVSVMSRSAKCIQYVQ